MKNGRASRLFRFFILLYSKCLSHLAALGKMLIERDNRLDAFVEVVEAVVLVGRVDSIFTEAKAHQDGLDTQHFLESCDNRDGAT